MNRYLRCYAEISLEAIGHNIREVKKRLPEGVKLLGVVKANAYGHGAVPVASYLENQVDYFATATIEEAVELRENGISAPILILGYVSPSQYGIRHHSDDRQLRTGTCPRKRGSTPEPESKSTPRGRYRHDADRLPGDRARCG